MDSFELEYGKVLKNIDVEYYTSGVPKYDEEGYITNAVIFCATHQGDFSALRGAYRSLKRKGLFDENEFFVITITSFGLPDSFSPSTSDLKYDFPQYSIKDVVNFKRQFISEKFKIKKILGILGEELGGYEVFTWASEYPEEMNFIFILNSDFKISGYRFIISKGFEAIIDSADDYYSDMYSVSLSKALVAVNTFLFAQAFSENVFNSMTNQEIEVLLEDFVDEGLSYDIYDFNFRNNALMNYDVEDKLSDIKANTLIIYSDDNVYFSQHLNEDILKNSIENLKILPYSSKKENYYDEEDYSQIGEEVLSFIRGCLDGE
jgi:homoserine O-acetyltransferase